MYFETFFIFLQLFSFCEQPFIFAHENEAHLIHLVVQYYVDSNFIRSQELNHALCINLCNPSIYKVHLLTSEKSQFVQKDIVDLCKGTCRVSGEKLTICRSSMISDQLKFNEAISYALDFIHNRPYNSRDLSKSDLFMISNADIYFDNTLRLLLDSHQTYQDLILNKNVYFLSRYEPVQSKHPFGTQCGPLYQDSHDTFIFSLSTPQRSVVEYFQGESHEASQLDAFMWLAEHANYALGSWGIENRIIYGLHRLGKLTN